MTTVPQKLSLRKIYDAFIKIDDGKTKNLYFADDLGIVIDAFNILRPFVFNERGPYLIEDYRLVLCRKGIFRTIVNLQECCIEAGTMAIIVPGTIVDPIYVSDDFSVSGIGISEDRLLLAHQHNLPSFLCSHKQSGFLKISEDEQLQIEQLFFMLWNLANEKIVSNTTIDKMLCVITHIFEDVLKNYDNGNNPSVNILNRQNEIFQKFIDLVNEHCRKERQLDFYADRLCVTKRHLGTVVHEVSGVTAKEWIDRAVITTAKVMLRHSTKSVVQISDELHFSTSSFFCKYFKRLTGSTPLEWRGEI